MTLVIVAAFAGALVQSTTGLGFALIVAPALLATLEPRAAIVALVPLAALVSVIVLAERRPVRWDVLRPLLAFAAPGAVAGMVILRSAPGDVLRVAVGLAVLAAVGLRIRARPPRISVPASVVGLVAGTMTTSVGVNGPPMALYMSRAGLAPAEIRATLAAAFLALGAMASVALIPVVADAFEVLDPATMAGAAGAVVAGNLAGRFVFARLHPERYERALLAVLTAAGLASVAGGLL